MKGRISWRSGRTGLGVVCLFIGLSLNSLAGTSTTFDVPGAQYTSPTAINIYGAVAGWYQDATAQIHGFVRTNDGTISTFDVPNGFNTTPVSININGSITGWYQGGTPGTHGFVRTSDGNFTTFDVPDGFNTTPTSINASGAVVGWYFVQSTFSYRSFLRAPDGTFNTFDVFGSNTYPATINDAGQIEVLPILRTENRAF